VPHECTNCGRQFDDGSKEMLSGCPNCGGNKFQFQPPGRAAADDSAASDTSATEASEPADAETPAADEVPDADAEREVAEPAEGSVEAAPETPASETADREPTAADDGEPDVAEAAGGLGEEFRDAELEDEVAAENRAQSDARSSAASPDEIDEARRKTADAEEATGSPSRGTPQGPPTETPTDDDPDQFDISGAVGPDEDVEKQPVAGSAPEHEEPISEDEDADLSSLREELNDQFESIKITAPGQYELNLMELYDRKEYIISLQEDGRYVIEMADDYGIDE